MKEIFIVFILFVLFGCNNEGNQKGFRAPGHVEGGENVDVQFRKLDVIPQKMIEKIMSTVECDSILRIDASAIFEKPKGARNYTIRRYNVSVYTPDNCVDWGFDFDANYKCTEAAKLSWKRKS